jgi:hypothetical protein
MSKKTKDRVNITLDHDVNQDVTFWCNELGISKSALIETLLSESCGVLAKLNHYDMAPVMRAFVVRYEAGLEGLE